MKNSREPLRIVAWGTYDLGKPRDRILLRGLRENGVEVLECHSDVWQGVEDKSQVNRWKHKLGLFGKWITAYPNLIYRYLRLPKHDAVLVPYLGQFDILVLWPFAKLRRRPIVLDAFLSLYNTVVEDRQLVGKHNPIAYALFALEWLAYRAADAILVDTNAHGRYFQATYNIPATKVCRVFVGAETEHFPTASPPAKEPTGNTFRVLFYGQFIPLHGIDTVVRAAKLTEGDGINWQLIGTGQEAERIRGLIRELEPRNLAWDHWVPYEELVHRIHAADVCLGIFGATDKASRVIPNKVFQILAVGTPIITRQSPAIRELITAGRGVNLIPAENPEALADAVREQMAQRVKGAPIALASIRHSISPQAIGLQLMQHIKAVVSQQDCPP